MALREHLTELRKRVVRAGLAILAGSIAGWFLYEPVFQYLTAPLQELADSGQQIQVNFNAVATSFDLMLKTSVWIGFIVSSPLWIYQLWAFITPGLTKKERRYAAAFVVTAAPLFLAGVGLAALFIPNAVEFFTGFTPEGGSNIIEASVYLGFVMRTVLTFGLAFLLPVVLVGLNLAGLLSGKAVLKAWRWVLVLCFAFAAIATPTPDIVPMFTLATPMVLLFALAIGICLLSDRRRSRREPSYSALADDEASALDDEAA
jgi:sec-independent protein translocase protein TatC